MDMNLIMYLLKAEPVVELDGGAGSNFFNIAESEWTVAASGNERQGG